MPSRPASRFYRRLGPLAALVAVALLVAGCNSVTLYPPTPVTDQGRTILGLYDIVFITAAIIFVAVEIALIYIVWRYRRQPGDETLPAQTHGHTGVETLWTVIPFVIVAFLFVISWQALGHVQADTAQPADVRIKVIGSQWCWEFDYIDAGVKVLAPTNSKGLNCEDDQGNPPTMVVPVNRLIRLQLHSVDVIHAFYVPQFLSKLDVVPQANEARDNIFDFTPREIGEYRGQCAEFCGLQHNGMRLAVSVRSQADYDAWVTAEKNKPSPSAAPSPPPGATILQVSASSAVSFEQSSLQAPASAPFVMHFENKQASVPHNVWIKDAGGKDVFQGPDVAGPGSADYQVAPLTAGTYTFYCHIHTNMTGSLEVR